MLSQLVDVAQAGRLQGGDIIFKAIQIAQSQKLRIDVPQFFDRHFECSNFAKQPARAQPVGRQQLFNRRQNRRAIDRGQRVMKFAVARDRNFVVCEQFKHPLDKRRHQQRDIAAGGVNDIGLALQRPKPGCQAFQRAAFGMFVVCDFDIRRQRRERLVRCRNDHDIRRHNDFRNQPHDPLQHRFRPERERSLVASHAGRFPAAEDDRALSHGDEKFAGWTTLCIANKIYRNTALLYREIMSLTLTYIGRTSLPVEIEGLTPDWAGDKSLAEIERFEIFHGNQKLPLAEMFKVSGDAADWRFDFEGNLAGVHWIGAQMKSGQIHIHGPAGRHVGSEMAGGEIRIEGDTGDWLGAEMHGGLIHVKGNAAHQVGAAYRGSAKGMTGGTILVDGDAGNEIGLRMRRGTIAIGGAAGDMIGFNMLAGTVLVFGNAGIRPGAGMRRGTIGLFGPKPPPLLPSFKRDSMLQPDFLRVMLRNLRGKGFQVGDALLDAEVDLYHGDLLALGRGEVFIRRN